MAPVQLEGVIQLRQSLGSHLISRVLHPSEGLRRDSKNSKVTGGECAVSVCPISSNHERIILHLHEHGGAQVRVRIPPAGRLSEADTPTPTTPKETQQSSRSLTYPKGEGAAGRLTSRRDRTWSSRRTGCTRTCHPASCGQPCSAGAPHGPGHDCPPP